MLLLRAAAAVAAVAASSGSSGPTRGFVYTSYSSGGYSRNASAVSLREAAATGVRVIELMATYYVDNAVNATRISADASASPTDADIVRALADAASAGLRVAMKPHIDSRDGVWRANIGTGFVSEEEWADFFSNYTAFVCHFARLAAAAPQPAVGFNVGTELDGTHGREAEWRAVIAAVRAILPGVPLWLGPNWQWRDAPGYTWVNFWDALDFLGVDMYAPLASHADPTLAEAVAGWAPLVANLSAFSAAHGGKPFIFAEIGYASYVNAAIDAPGCCSGPPDLATQAVLYESFFAAVWPQPWLAGVFWWAWPENEPGGDPCSTSFSVFAKPAAAVVKQAYGAAPAARRQSAAAPISVYADGATAFADWSWGATVDLKSTANPYPGHAMSAAVSVAGNGALALHAPAPLNVSGLTTLEFDLHAPNASSSFGLTAYLCPCDSCSACGGALPARAVDRYAPPSAPCTVPAAWTPAARIRIPLADLLPDSGAAPTIARLQIASQQATQFAVDNIAFT